MVEPFAGSASIFFHFQPETAWLNDINEDLINSYVEIRESWETLYSIYFNYGEEHCSEFYYRMREHLPTSGLERAARFIYLNRTCFNGIYRINKNGSFNVPIGTKAVTLPTDDFEHTSGLLARAKLTNLDFEEVIKSVDQTTSYLSTRHIRFNII